MWVYNLKKTICGPQAEAGLEDVPPILTLGEYTWFCLTCLNVQDLLAELHKRVFLLGEKAEV